MDIRIAQAADAARLVEFNQAMAMETEGKALETSVLKAGVEAVFAGDDKGYYVVAVDGGEIVGGLLVTREWSDWRNNWFWWIQSVYIVEEFRGKQIYSRMYDFVKQKAAEAGNVCGFRLYVEKENIHAQKVYKKLGMDETHYLMYEEKM